MVDSNKEKVENQVESLENNNDVESTELLEEAKVYLAEEEVAEAKEFIREEEIKTDGKLLLLLKALLIQHHYYFLLIQLDFLPFLYCYLPSLPP